MTLREYESDDLEAVVDLWIETKELAYPYLPTERAYTRANNVDFFRDYIAPRCAIWLADGDDRLVGFLAIEGSYIDRLYVHPSCQRGGVGAELLAKARELSPRGLELHTHQQNVAACTFYEKHGFRPARFGTSGPPESMPDVEYHWRP